MVTAESVRKIALGFEEVQEMPHFEKTSFRIKNKIIATMGREGTNVVVFLSEVDQSVFTDYDSSVFYPVPGYWGRKGATIIVLKKVRKDMLTDALTISYCRKAPRKLAEKYRQT